MSIIKKILFYTSKPITKKINSLRNTHLGESCYIFGDGISIKWININNFNNKPAFALNNFYFHKDINNLDLRYLVIPEPWFFYPYNKMPKWSNKLLWRNKINKMHKDIIKKNKITTFVSLSNYPILLLNKNVFYLFKIISDNKFYFQNDCIKENINPFAGSFTTAITIAIYMGFNEVLLIGCDYTHALSRKKHWYEKGFGIIEKNDNLYNKKFLEIVKKHIIIKTLTIENDSKLVESTTYTQYTGAEPKFRENNELANKETLELLATWPGYSIF